MTLQQILDNHTKAHDRYRKLLPNPNVGPHPTDIKAYMAWLVRHEMLRLKLIDFIQYERMMDEMHLIIKDDELQFE